VRANLIADRDLLLLLLDTRNWRERVVEEFVFGLGEHVRVTSTYQFGIAEESIAAAYRRSFWSRRLPGRQVPDRVRLLLPVATRDKRPLLNFTLTGPEQSDALLVPRDLSAQLQAAYLRELLDAASPDRAGSVGAAWWSGVACVCVSGGGRRVAGSRVWAACGPWRALLRRAAGRPTRGCAG